MKIERSLLRKIVEGALLAADGPLNLAKLAKLFEVPEGEADVGDLYEKPSAEDFMAVLEEIQADCEGRGYELKQVASGWRFQVVQEVAPWINRLWEEKPQRYSRALMETLALIAYRQPITRGDIESIRGVAVSSTIIKTLTEREWVKVVGHRDVPGRPALYATTRQFLDYFNLKSLDELPSLKEIQDFNKLDAELDLTAALGEIAAEADVPADDSNSGESAVETTGEATQPEELEVGPGDSNEIGDSHDDESGDPLSLDPVNQTSLNPEPLNQDPLNLDEPFTELHPESADTDMPDASAPAPSGDDDIGDATALEREEL